MTEPVPPPPGLLPRRPATREQATALASGIRLRILRLTYHEPLTNRELSQALRRDPATTLHHVRKLVATGFLEALPVRRGTRGSREIPYRSTGLSWAMDPPVDGDQGPIGEAMLEAFLGEVADAGVEGVMQTRLALRLDAEQAEQLQQRLNAVLADFAALPVRPGAPLLGVYVAVYPTPVPSLEQRKPGARRATMEEV